MARVAAAETSAKNHRVSWGTGVKPGSVSNGNGGMAASVLFPDDVCVTVKNKENVIDINHFHVFLACVPSSVLKAATQQHVIQLVRKLAPCAECSMARDIHIARAAVPVDMVHIDTTGPHQELSEARSTSSCSWKTLPSSSARKGPGTRAHPPFPVW